MKKGFWYWAWPINRPPSLAAVMQLIFYAVMAIIIALPPSMWLVSHTIGPALRWWGNYWLWP